MNDPRPTNIDLFKFKWPLPAITSILHRISGVYIFLGVPLLLYLMELSLSSEAGYSEASELLFSPLARFLTWTILAGLLYHLVAGCKHLLMDLGIGETLAGARRGAIATLVIGIILMILAGVWLW